MSNQRLRLYLILGGLLAAGYIGYKVYQAYASANKTELNPIPYE